MKKLVQKADALEAFQGREPGFTLIEVVVSVAVLGVLLVSLYGGLTYGFGQIQVSREEERATQILAEKMEIVRLFSWDQLVNISGYIPTNFTASYAVANPTNAPTSSLIYSGTVSVVPAPVSENYSNDLKMMVINLSWQSRGVTHRRSMRTFVSRYGLQNYTY